MIPLSSQVTHPAVQATSVVPQGQQAAVQAAPNNQITQAGVPAINQGGAAAASQAKKRELPNQEALHSNSKDNAHRMGVNYFGGIRKPPEQKLRYNLAAQRERLERDEARAQWQVSHPAEYAAHLNAIEAQNERFWNGMIDAGQSNHAPINYVE